MSANVTQRILIIGGGIGGLTLAIALRDLGLEVEVFERAREFREIGSGLVLSPNGVRALDKLGGGVGQELRAAGGAGNDAASYPFLDWKGKVTFSQSFEDLESKWGAPLIPILRSDLHNILRRALPQEVLHANARFTSFEQDAEGVTARFADGRALSGDLLVGADGIRSTVRAGLFGENPLQYLGITSIRGVVKLADSPYPGGFLTSGPGLQIFVAALGGERYYWAATLNAKEGTWPGKPLAEAHKALLERVGAWHPPVPAMVSATPLESLVVTDIHDRPPLASWSKGRVTLLGDAAHPMSPFMGQGANMAIEDALCLARCISESPDVGSALGAYEAERLARTSGMAKQSRQIGMMGQWENPLACWLRDRMMAVMSRFMDPRKQEEWLYGYEA